jgi:hypothetical protein
VESKIIVITKVFLITPSKQIYFLGELNLIAGVPREWVGPSIQVIGIVLELGIGIRRITTPS